MPRPSALQGILEQLHNGEQPEVAYARLADAISGGNVSLDELLDLLRSADTDSVLLGIRGLAMMGTEDAIDVIIETVSMATDNEWQHRLAEAAFGITNPVATASLFELVTAETNALLVEIGQRSLAAMGGQAALLEAVARCRLATDEATRDALLAIIRYDADPTLVEMLSTLADQDGRDYGTPLAIAIVDTLGIIGTEEAVHSIFSRMPSASATGPLTEGISRVSNPNALASILAVADDPSLPFGDDARLAAVRALANFHTEESASILLRLTQATNEVSSLRTEAERSLNRANGTYTPDFTR